MTGKSETPYIGDGDSQELGRAAGPAQPMPAPPTQFPVTCTSKNKPGLCPRVMQVICRLSLQVNLRSSWVVCGWKRDYQHRQDREEGEIPVQSTPGFPGLPSLSLVWAQPGCEVRRLQQAWGGLSRVLREASWLQNCRASGLINAFPAVLREREELF